ncbi:MAG: hypothetical protein ABIM17_06130 [candidate division WOR-3 bacterium]
MLKKMLTLIFSLFIFFNSVYGNTNGNTNSNSSSRAIEELTQNFEDTVNYYKFLFDYIQHNKIADAFSFVRLNEMYVLSKLFTRGHFCMVALFSPDVYQKIARLDKEISSLLQSMCIVFPESPLSFIKSGTGNMIVKPYTFYFNHGIIVRIDLATDKKISIIPADLNKYMSLFSQKPTDFSQIFDQEFIVSVQIEPNLRAMYKTNPLKGIVEILDISSIVDIKRNFVSLSNITYNELVLFLLEYYRETVREKGMHSSLDFITKFMTSLLEQEKFVTWLTQKYSNQLMGVKKSKDEKDVKTQKRKGVKK